MSDKDVLKSVETDNFRHMPLCHLAAQPDCAITHPLSVSGGFMTDAVLTGLAKQLVHAELLTESVAQQAYQQARRNKISLVSYLVQSKLVKSLDRKSVV